ncbi:MAG: nitrate reductase [Myxococcales bacterium]|nr:MAG: nitrate reductase [Myxococcales bacterium]
MTIAVYLVVYLALIVFIVAVVQRIVRYLKKPVHVRWELYPVAHEGHRASYGGSYLEDVDWWKKPRHSSLLGELKVMIPEILLLKAVFEHNRRLWYVSFPFHFGLYVLIGFIVLLKVGAMLELAGYTVGDGGPGLGNAVAALTGFVGPLGYLLCLVGAVGLLLRRFGDPTLRNYSSFSHFFNLLLFIALIVLSSIVWLTIDPHFQMLRGFVKGLITLSFAPLDNALFAAQIIFAALVIAYIPLTHMSHFFMKYFLWHDIRWGDKPNIDAPDIASRIATVLNYPVSWAAPHIAGDGKKTWAEVATTNPAQPKAAKE